MTYHEERSARELLAGSLGSDPWERLDQLEEAGERRARAEAQLKQMEHYRKIVLSRVSSKIAKTGKFSEAKLERLARASEEYSNHVEGLAAAVEERELAVAEYWRLRALLEWDAKAVSHLNAVSRLQEPG